MWVNFNKQATF